MNEFIGRRYFNFLTNSSVYEYLFNVNGLMSLSSTLLSSKPMLQKLQWPTLEERRKEARLTLLYKVANGEVKIGAGNKLLPPDRLSRHNNAQSFQIPSCKTSIRKESFHPKTVRDCNNLLAPVIAAESLDSFKRLLITY